MKKIIYKTLALLTIAILLLAGCTSSPEHKARKKANIKVPNLKGGPEFRTRTGEHPYMLPNVVFRKGSGTVKQVALTFDDGPDAYYTPKILDILAKNNIKATFFIVGQRAQSHPEMVKRIVNAGHAIGNHTWNHADLDKLTPEQIRSEVTQTDNILTTLSGTHTNLFRPPYGIASQQVVTELDSMGYKVIDWSVDTRDWARTPPAQIMKYVQKELQPGGIILEHCAGGKHENLNNTVTALPQIIAYLQKQGYTMVTIPELLGFPK